MDEQLRESGELTSVLAGGLQDVDVILIEEFELLECELFGAESVGLAQQRSLTLHLQRLRMMTRTRIEFR